MSKVILKANTYLGVISICNSDIHLWNHDIKKPMRAPMLNIYLNSCNKLYPGIKPINSQNISSLDRFDRLPTETVNKHHKACHQTAVMAFRIISAITTLLLMTNLCKALDNGLALTPPMGFLSWERFRCDTDCGEDPTECISEALYKDMADRMASDGYLEAGYQYVNIDDCWLAHERDADGKLQPDPTRFPSGILALADYIHKSGLKFGIYEDYGNFTCGGYPGVLGHLELDAQTFADWQVDYLKLDGCYADIFDMETGYPEMGRYLNATGRPMVYSCSWPAYWTGNNLDPDYQAIEKSCNLWRNWNDIDDSWDSVLSIIDYFGDNQDELIPHAGPGHWNDPDMIIVGDFGLSYDESQVQMAIWSILAAPLLVSTDLRNIKQEFKDIILNKNVIAIDQDPLGMQGRRVYKEGNIEIWNRPVTPVSDTDDHSYAIAFLNRNTAKEHVTTTLQDIGLTYASGYDIVDLYNGDDYGRLLPENDISVLVNPSGVIFVKATIAS